MSYEIRITETVKKALKKWDSERRERFYSKVSKLEDYPMKFGKPLRGKLAGLWELYFENSFRILYEVDQNDDVVYIKEVRHKDDF